MAEIEPTPKNIIAKFCDYPLAEVPIQVFLNNTDSTTYKAISGDYGDMIIASTTWHDPLNMAERVAILYEARSFQGKGVALNFYWEWVSNRYPNLLEQFYNQCRERRNIPLDNTQFSITALPHDTGDWSATSGHSYRYQIRLEVNHPTLLLGEYPTAITWLLERSLEAAKLADVAVAKRKILRNGLTAEWSKDTPSNNDDFWRKELENDL